MSQFEKLVLFDGNNVLVKMLRAAWGNQTALSADGINTAPLLFFINVLSRQIRGECPDAVVICWDGGRSHRRMALSPVVEHGDGTRTGYKAKRSEAPPEEAESFAFARAFLDLAGIPDVRLAHEEADDLIGAYVATTRARQIVIVSDDHDLRQLITPAVTQVPVSPKSADDRWTYDRVLDHYGCAPYHLPSLMALMGDPGDGVVGMKGIGPKKALKLLQSVDFHWPLLLDGLSEEDRATVHLAYELVDLRHPPRALLDGLPPVRPFTPITPGSARWELLEGFLAGLQMTSVLDRLAQGVLWPVESETSVRVV